MPPEIEEFGALLIREVRDKAIASCDNDMRADVDNPAARNLRNRCSGHNTHALAEALIPDCVDEALFYLLHAIDNGLLRLTYTARNGNAVDLTADGLGELAGWYMGSSDAWRPKYSQQRFNDYNAGSR
jgi:hypothetical protein